MRSLVMHLAERGHQVTVVTSDACAEPDFWQHRPPKDRPTQEPDGQIDVVRCRAVGVLGGRTALLLWRKAMVSLSALPGDQSSLLIRMARLIPAIPGLATALEQPGSYDVVHGFNLSWEHPLVEAWRFARRRGLPFVITPFAHLGVGQGDRLALNNTMDHQRRMLADADAVLAMTTIEQEHLERLGVHPQRTFVVGTGLDPLPPAQAIENALTRLPDSHTCAPTVVFIGRTSRDKGAIQAAEAIGILSRRGVSVRLALIGRVTPEFQRYHDRLPTKEKQVILPMGIVDEPTKSAVLSRSAMLVLPSRTDSFGIALLEAWAHGKPVIGARAGGIPGVIAEGQDGLLVEHGRAPELAEAIARLLADERLAEALGAHGRQKTLSEHTWEIVCSRVCAVYNAVKNKDGISDTLNPGPCCSRTGM